MPHTYKNTKDRKLGLILYLHDNHLGRTIKLGLFNEEMELVHHDNQYRAGAVNSSNIDNSASIANMSKYGMTVFEHDSIQKFLNDVEEIASNCEITFLIKKGTEIQNKLYDRFTRHNPAENLNNKYGMKEISSAEYDQYLVKII